MLNNDLINSFNKELFFSNIPCPWFCFEKFLTDEAFNSLCYEYPPFEKFEHHKDIYRKYGQRSHDRYYLALEKSIYGDHRPGTKGCIGFNELPENWQEFIKLLNSDINYLNFIEKLLGTNEINIRFAWHMAGSGYDVSPHKDAGHKIGTHIFYFNTSKDWNRNWGGSTVFLSGKKITLTNPEFEDFADKFYTDIGNNYSMLFRNNEKAWHGVEPLKCPEGKYRRIFNVIFEKPGESENI